MGSKHVPPPAPVHQPSPTENLPEVSHNNSPEVHRDKLFAQLRSQVHAIILRRIGTILCNQVCPNTVFTNNVTLTIRQFKIDVIKRLWRFTLIHNDCYRVFFVTIKQFSSLSELWT